jgi:hypothetical protein
MLEVCECVALRLAPRHCNISPGLGVLFGKLQQGVQENQQILTVARMRADAEELYGSKLGDIGPATDRIQGGFARDEGASVRKVSAYIFRFSPFIGRLLKEPSGLRRCSCGDARGVEELAQDSLQHQGTRGEPVQQMVR